jgi:DNA-binding transcriptional LysR family regulator
MDMFQLEIFVSIAQTKNFTRSAELFCITQPAVSHNIKMLEKSLGVKLITRSMHGVALTEEGKEFLPYVRQMLSTLSTAETRIQNMAEGRVGHIRIAAVSSTSNQLSECMLKLYESYPSIQVDIDLLEGSDMLDTFERGEYDFYFTVQTMIAEHKEYDSVVIHEDSLELYVNKGVADTIKLDDWSTVERHPFVSVIMSDAQLSNQISTICKNRGFKPRIINYYNRAESVVLSVNAGIGIAILPGELNKLYQRDNVVTFPIEGNDTSLTSIFAWKKDTTTTACILFRDIVLSLYGGVDGAERAEMNTGNK